MLPLFIDIIGTDNKRYSINANHILYISTTEKKGEVLTGVVLDRKESIDSEETQPEIETKIKMAYLRLLEMQREANWP
jgi:hypothetical protein